MGDSASRGQRVRDAPASLAESLPGRLLTFSAAACAVGPVGLRSADRGTAESALRIDPLTVLPAAAIPAFLDVPPAAATPAFAGVLLAVASGRVVDNLSAAATGGVAGYPPAATPRKDHDVLVVADTQVLPGARAVELVEGCPGVPGAIAP